MPRTCRESTEQAVCERKVAVMMPFAEEFRATYRAIQRACRKLGLSAVRADEIWNHAALYDDIQELIASSPIVVADCSARNQNVMYETGYAHGRGKRVILITRSIEDVPTDLRHLRALVYLPNGEGLRALENALVLRLRTIFGSEGLNRQLRSGRSKREPRTH